jgi:hypothetical protein
MLACIMAKQTKSFFSGAAQLQEPSPIKATGPLEASQGVCHHEFKKSRDP